MKKVIALIMAVMICIGCFTGCTLSAATVDAVEVVRCKDCNNCCETVDRFGKGLFCKRWSRDWKRVQPDDFCSYGERREGE